MRTYFFHEIIKRKMPRWPVTLTLTSASSALHLPFDLHTAYCTAPVLERKHPECGRVGDRALGVFANASTRSWMFCRTSGSGMRSIA